MTGENRPDEDVSGGDVLIIADESERASSLREKLAFPGREVRIAGPGEEPADLESCGLLIWMGDPDRGGPGAAIERLAHDSHAVLVLPKLNPRWIAHYLRYGQVRAFFGREVDGEVLGDVLTRLVDGGLADLEWVLPAAGLVRAQQVSSYDDRCRVLDGLTRDMKQQRLRGKQRRSVELVAEELLLNAMYQAPVDEKGERAFADADPKDRMTAETPRPVFTRYCIHRGAVYVAVRDHYGSFRREDLASHLLRCAGKDQIEDKKLGAGLGLFQVASSASRMLISVLPGKYTEFACVIEPPATQSRTSLSVLTLSSRPAEARGRTSRSERTSLNLASVLAELRDVLEEVTSHAGGGGGERSGHDTLIDMPAPGQGTITDWPPTSSSESTDPDEDDEDDEPR